MRNGLDDRGYSRGTHLKSDKPLGTLREERHYNGV